MLGGKHHGWLSESQRMNPAKHLSGNTHSDKLVPINNTMSGSGLYGIINKTIFIMHIYCNYMCI